MLSLTERRVAGDWPTRFGHPLLLLETFVDPQRFHGGVYRAANWMELGRTQGYRRTKDGCSAQADGPKRVLVRPLCRDAPTPAVSQEDSRSAPPPGAAATLCGMRGYNAIFDWAIALGQQARERFDCRRENGRYVVPSEYVIRDCLVRIEPGALDRALTEWNRVWATRDEALAMEGKTMKNAFMSVVGHEAKRSYAPKKQAPCP